MITIYKTGLYDFTDLGLVKPVKFTVNDLKEIASTTGECEITDEHSQNVIGKLSNFVVEDDCLKVNKPENVDVKGMGLSPLFNIGELIDNGDYYSVSKPVMSSVGLTKTPRTHILYNSIKNESSGEYNHMDDTQLRDALDRNKALNEEIGVLKSQIKQLKSDNEVKSKTIKELQESSKDDKYKDYDDLKVKASAYDKILEEERQDLIKQLAGDNTELAKEYDGFSTENLRVVLKNQQMNNHSGRGITNNQTIINNGENPNPQNEEEYSWDDFDKDFLASGL